MTIARPLTTETSVAIGTEAADPLLRIHGLAKAYGQVEALRGVSIDFRAGEIHAVVGENGAGKSTLTRLLSGEEKPDSGEIVIDGRARPLRSPAEARRAGIAIVHQHFQLVEALTAAENICLEDVPRRRIAGLLPLLDNAAMTRRAAKRLAAFRLAHRAGSRIRDLAVAEKQIVEIARAIGSDARLLILDEPTSALSTAETETLFSNVRKLRAEGVAILFIAHNLSEVLSIADRISVLRDGRLITTALAGTLDAAALARLIVGRELAALRPYESLAPGDVVFSVSPRISGEPLAELRGGEILGMPTYIGSALRGFLARISGESGAGALRMTLRGSDITRSGVAARVRRGLCLVPGDATAEALAPKLTVADNILLPNAALFTRLGIWRRKAARAAVQALIRDLDIRPPNGNAAVENLSGGNRQKVAIAKWLLSGAQVLVMDDPTRGVDVGAKVELYRIMRGHVEKRGAILLASSDLDELIALADRMVVLRGESVVKRFDEKPFGKADILAASAMQTEIPQAEASS